MNYKEPTFPRQMSRQEELEMHKRYIEERIKKVTPESARQNLFDAGLIDEDGNEAAWLSDPDNFTMRFFRR